MTKSTITREQLEEWVAQFDEDGGCDATDRQLEALIRQSLAALDSEPVAFTDERNLGYIDRGRETAYLWGKQNSESSDVALYRHAQQPGVPEEATPDSIEILASARRRDHAVFQWDEDQRNAAADSWNACRAAMPAAAPQSPGSEPATVPGKWIQVSERMPESNKFVLVSNGVWVGQGLYDDSEHLESDEHWQDEHREFINVLHHPVTHWMPLPAAPQEVKGE